MTTITIYFKDKERKPETKTCSFVKVFGSFMMLVMDTEDEEKKKVYTYPSDIIDYTVSESKVNKESRGHGRHKDSVDL